MKLFTSLILMSSLLVLASCEIVPETQAPTSKEEIAEETSLSVSETEEPVEKVDETETEEQAVETEKVNEAEIQIETVSGSDEDAKDTPSLTKTAIEVEPATNPAPVEPTTDTAVEVENEALLEDILKLIEDESITN